LTLNKANLEAATGRIVDVDVAEESTQLAKWTTLTQAGTAMLAQANQANSLVLKLIGQ
jgi:flagellin